MYIDSFFLGVLSTILAEFAVLLVVGIIRAIRKGGDHEEH